MWFSLSCLTIYWTSLSVCREPPIDLIAGTLRSPLNRIPSGFSGRPRRRLLPTFFAGKIVLVTPVQYLLPKTGPLQPRSDIWPRKVGRRRCSKLSALHIAIGPLSPIETDSTPRAFGTTVSTRAHQRLAHGNSSRTYIYPLVVARVLRPSLRALPHSHPQPTCSS